MDLSLLSGGVRAEREQRITIDVAYRRFGTPRRALILADTPGPFATRGIWSPMLRRPISRWSWLMRNGIVQQSRRCLFLHLLRIPHVVVCKQDESCRIRRGCVGLG